MQPFSVYAQALAIAVFGALGCLHGSALHRAGTRRDSRQAPRQARFLTGLGLAFVAVNFAYMLSTSHPAVEWFLPEIVELHAMSVGGLLDLAVMSFLFTALVTMAFRERHRLRWVLGGFCVMALLAAVLQFHQNHAGNEKLEFSYPRVSKDGVILQTNGSTCAAAAGANIARHFGLDTSEKEMAESMGVTDAGATPAQITHALRALNLSAKKRYLWNRDIHAVHPPAILMVDLVGARDGHAVTYMGIQDGKAEIWDPSGGKRFVTPDELRETWHGRCIEVNRPSGTPAHKQ